ncbi:MAG: response regulator [Candidatus Omnitrophica bacterium]|nr:response regulator [Candidatus Omnitrophota bacterium]
MSKPRILICDDEPGVRDSLKLILEGHFNLAFAADGEEALLQIKSLHPDLAILDIKMPRMNGLECLKQIKLLDPKLKVLVLTGYESGDVASEAVRAGAANYLTKPLDRQKLLSEVQSLLTPQGP